MKILAVLTAVFLSLPVVSLAQAPTPVIAAPGASAPPLKIATIFGQNAIVSTQEGQKASAALTTRYAPKKDEFTRKQAELQTLREQLKRTQATMNTDARDKLNQAIDAKNKELQRLGEDSQAALEQEEGAMLQELGDKLLQIVRQYASRNGYAVVLDVSLPNGPVVWASPSVDITNEIVKLYDQAYPVASAPPVAPPVKK
jgi:outer membrane protein